MLARLTTVVQQLKELLLSRFKIFTYYTSDGTADVGLRISCSEHTITAQLMC